LAMFNDISDFPSDGPELVTARLLGKPFSVENCNAVQRAVRFTERQSRIGKLFLDIARPRNDSERRHARHLLRLLDGADLVVESLEKISGAESCAKTKRQGHEEHMHQAWRGGGARNLRAVHHEDVVDADPRSHVDFLEALKQTRMQLAVGVDLAFQDVVLDAALLQIEHLLP
jgi:hypothetical protein